MRNLVEKSELWVFKVKQVSEKKSKKQSEDAESKVNINCMREVGWVFQFYLDLSKWKKTTRLTQVTDII